MRNRGVMAVGLAAAGLILVGCGAAEPTAAPPLPAASASPAVLLDNAAQTTRSAGSARIMSTMTVGSGADGTSVRAEGVVDFEGDEAALRVSSSIFGGGSDLQVILSQDTSYIQVPMFGQKWVAMPLKDLNVNLPDPSSSLDMLTDLADLTVVGKEPVDGVEATKYTGRIDVKDAIGLAPQLPSARTPAAPDLDKVSGTVAVTVWVDEEQRIVRFDQRGTIDTGAGAPMASSSSTTLTDFGVATDIAPPPADQVIEGEKLSQLDGLAGTGG